MVLLEEKFKTMSHVFHGKIDIDMNITFILQSPFNSSKKKTHFKRLQGWK